MLLLSTEESGIATLLLEIESIMSDYNEKLVAHRLFDEAASLRTKVLVPCLSSSL